MLINMVSGNKSTYMAVLSHVDNLTPALENGEYVVGVYLDSSKVWYCYKSYFSMGFVVVPMTGLQAICLTDHSSLI